MTPIFQLLQKPVYQGLFYILLTIVATLIMRPRDADKVWVICGLMYCFFILTNAACAFFTVEVWPYFFVSLGFSLLYLVLIAVVANLLINALKLEGSAESAMVFLVIIFHPVALLLSILLKWAFSN